MSNKMKPLFCMYTTDPVYTSVHYFTAPIATSVQWQNNEDLNILLAGQNVIVEVGPMGLAFMQ